MLVAEPDLIVDTIPLTSKERALKAELESVVEGGLEQFLKVGQALAELRNRRLYRISHATFSDYVRDRFGLARSSVDQLIRSSQTAEALLEAGIELSPGVTEAVIRPISALPDSDELKAATWEFIQTVAPEHVTQPIVSRICRLIKDTLDGGNEYGQENKEPNRRPYSRTEFAPCGPRKSPERETSFVRPLLRLSSWQGFSLELVLSHAEKLDNAKSLYSACSVMRERCRLVQERLAANYPELATYA